MAQAHVTKGLLIDLDGVLYQSGHLIDGADHVVAWIVNQRISHRFLTNTTSRPRSEIVQKLRSMKIEVEETDILTPPIAATSWLKKHASGPVAFFVPDKTKLDFSDIEQLPPDAECGASAVVLGDIGDAWTFAELNRAFRLLMSDPKPILLALGMTRYWQTASGLQLDVAPFVKALEYAADCESVMLGKPSSEFFEQALQSLGCDARETMMIGDDVMGDVQGAQRVGIRGALVKTGKFRPKDLEVDPSPDVVFDSISDLPEWWGQHAE